MVYNSNLVGFREITKKTKHDMSKILGVSASFYEKIEKGERNPSYNFIKKFKSKFPDADIDNIFFDSKPHEKCKNADTA